MTEHAERPFGLWDSPVTPKSIAQSVRLGDSAWDSDGQTLVWQEGRGDRGVLVCSKIDGHAPRDLTDELSVRARVGYGGGDFCVGGGCIYFVSNGRLYRQELKGGRAKSITPAFGQPASPVLSPNGKWLIFVYSAERIDGLATVDTEGKQWPRKVSEGHDFYMQPRVSPDGKWAAWVSWDHPLMPWDGTFLCLAEIKEDESGLPVFKNERLIVGSDKKAVFQPEFSPDSAFLAFLCDEGDWHNLYLHDLAAAKTKKLTHEHTAQLGQPAWQQGLRSFGFSHDSRSIYCVRNERGLGSLWAYETSTGKPTAISGLESYTDLQQPALNPTRPLIAMTASSGKQPPRIIVKALAGSGSTTVIKRATSESVPPEAFAAPKPITWKSGAETIHGLLYLPEGITLHPEGGVLSATGIPAPAIVRIHGGPTGQWHAEYNAGTQFFVTRGYVVLEVNYRGSTGYGRKYMDALRGNWGVCDVEDAVSGARLLDIQGIADGKKVVIMGGSAGGFTVLQALATHPKFFKAGICLYGVSNMFTLAADTHKFEERYLDSILGPLPAAGPIYRERSPVFHAEKIVDPIAIYQGDIDEVVPRAQSDTIVESLRKRNVPHVYQVYQGEGHGWRKAETIEHFYTSVDKFLKEYVLFA